MAAMLVIGALTYFGITNPSYSLPDKYQFSNGFEVKDYQITTSQIKLKVVNTFGQTLYAASQATSLQSLRKTMLRA